ncbi:MAG: response regulator transcription factor [Spirochaetales bacterium]|nr:response regulator transcription factor [Spirochaetales bacterium]
MKKKDDVVTFVIITRLQKLNEILKQKLLEYDHYNVIEYKDFHKNLEAFLLNNLADFIIISCDNKDLSNITIIKNLKQRFPELFILVIAEDNALKHIHALCNAGADGFLIKEELSKLHDAIETILSGKRYVNQILLNCLLQNVLANASDTYDDHFAIFNLKEHQVFQLIDAGYSENIIAKTLDISLEKVLLYKNRLSNKIQAIEPCKK